MDPRDLGELPVGESAPDLADIVRVDVDFLFPSPGCYFGVMAPVEAQQIVVVGVVMDADAAFGDGLPPHRQDRLHALAAHHSGKLTSTAPEGCPGSPNTF
ncbi:hypothetical protein ABWJ92_38050 [Streptomyces sp. NPDC000609]|uniref:hypothetical protein n=1 Tax=Streptomyces sp. NPDC000609 TaxID=3160957 RepID=UPI003396EA61